MKDCSLVILYQRYTRIFHFDVIAYEGQILGNEKGVSEFTNLALCKV